MIGHSEDTSEESYRCKVYWFLPKQNLSQRSYSRPNQDKSLSDYKILRKYAQDDLF